ncbi:MAG TPA: HepT-like ribonuclease domain-containing protein, partial [Candidatus Solibacter sp.]|nr:HepT-like ribonuclease domain-containing protein [Candidatus Solibacter sp.]
ASRRVPREALERHPTIDWPAIAGAGNIYRHDYDAIDEALIWHTVHHGLSTLRNAAAQEFERYR